MDLSETEEEEKEEQNNKKEKEAEQTQEKEEEPEEAKEKEEEAEDRKQEGGKRKQETRISAPVFEATPVRALRSTNNRLNSHTLLQPAPTTTPASIPSQLFPPPQLQRVDIELQLVTEVQIAICTPTPEPVPITLSPPTSPLPELDFSFLIKC